MKATEINLTHETILNNYWTITEHIYAKVLFYDKEDKTYGILIEGILQYVPKDWFKGRFFYGMPPE